MSTDVIYEMVTERILATLAEGVSPWAKPWANGTGHDGLPVKMPSGKPYRGINIFLLGAAEHEHGYTSAEWGTYKHIASRGGQVRKGEKSSIAIFWKRIKIRETDETTGQLTDKVIPLLRYFRVFNACQADGLTLPKRQETPKPQGAEIDNAAQALAANYLLSKGPKLEHAPRNQASYNPASDLVQMPDSDLFVGTAEYYSTLFHELTHSTGHTDRLSRDGITEHNQFGSPRYSKEELVAEMGAAMLCTVAGVDSSASHQNSAAYLKGWAHKLQGESPKLIVQAAGQAQRAADLIQGISYDD